MNGPQLDVVGIVVDDMPKSLAFYRQLGLDMPAEADARPHVEAALAGGMRLAWDTIDEVRTFAPDYEPSAGDGRIGLAFRLDPGGRRCHLQPTHRGRAQRPPGTLGCRLGPAVRDGPRPRRQRRRPVRPPA